MRLTTTKGGLEVDNRCCRGSTRNAVRCLGEQVLEASGEEGPAEELDGVGVLRRGGTRLMCDRMQVGRELGLLETSAQNIGMRLEDLAPRRQIDVAEAGD